MVLVVRSALAVVVFAMAPSEGASGHPSTMLVMLLMVLELVWLHEHGPVGGACEAGLRGFVAGGRAHDYVVVVLIFDREVSGLGAGTRAGPARRLGCPVCRRRHVDREEVARVHIDDLDDRGPAIEATLLLPGFASHSRAQILVQVLV